MKHESRQPEWEREAARIGGRRKKQKSSKIRPWCLRDLKGGCDHAVSLDLPLLPSHGCCSGKEILPVSRTSLYVKIRWWWSISIFQIPSHHFHRMFRLNTDLFLNVHPHKAQHIPSLFKSLTLYLKQQIPAFMKAIIVCNGIRRKNVHEEEIKQQQHRFGLKTVCSLLGSPPPLYSRLYNNGAVSMAARAC